MGTYQEEFQVTSDMSALSLGSGGLSVLGTPALVALVEKVCYQMLTPELDSESTSVGTHIMLDHLKGSDIGVTITVNILFFQLTGRQAKFEFEVYEKDTLIAKGIHNRVVVNKKKFLERL